MHKSKVSESRKRTHSIMANVKWCDLVWQKDEISFVIPQELIRKDTGEVYKSVTKLINSGEYSKLEDKGVKVCQA